MQVFFARLCQWLHIFAYVILRLWLLQEVCANSCKQLQKIWQAEKSVAHYGCSINNPTKYEIKTTLANFCRQKTVRNSISSFRNYVTSNPTRRSTPNKGNRIPQIPGHQTPGRILQHNNRSDIQTRIFQICWPYTVRAKKQHSGETPVRSFSLLFSEGRQYPNQRQPSSEVLVIIFYHLLSNPTMNTFNPTFSGHRTIRSIIWSKVLDSIESISLLEMFINLGLGVVSGCAAYALIHPDHAQAIAQAINEWHNYAFAKTVLSFGILFNARKIYHIIKILVARHAKQVPTGETLEGIPIVEILDHLFEFQSFKRDDIEKKFWIPRNRFTDLAQKLEELGILARGENNARVLNPEYSRSDIASVLQGAERSGDINKVFREVKPNSFTSEPTGKTILERVKSFLSPSPRFTPHRIGEE